MWAPRSYIYGGVSYPALAFASGSNLNKCERLAIKALKVDEQCMHVSCTFGGVWSGGGGGAGQNNLYLASYFFERAAEAGIIDPRVPAAIVRPTDFHDAAKRACKTNLKDAKHTYPHVEDGNLPYICMDFVYLFRLLVDGFGCSKSTT
ncbi:unnamed protein product [Thlaspi arvense]|uniref:apyrase n=1 Tax=Thlaspi arvense TaxID=13288 RepID=A0AAU9RS86_THLAR|nr:unnamed protein product [Thlaspi arvense]